jgi:hypothetical protein
MEPFNPSIALAKLAKSQQYCCGCGQRHASPKRYSVTADILPSTAGEAQTAVLRVAGRSIEDEVVK